MGNIEVFGKSAIYETFIPDLHAEASGRTYTFADFEHLTSATSPGSAVASQIAREYLARAHWAATSALGRNIRWMNGTVAAARSPNLLAFSSCLRAFIEAAGDTHDSLSNVSVTLAENAESMMLGLRGERLVNSRDLEDALIHFQFARQAKKGSVPDAHRAKRPTQYRELLEDTFERLGVPKSRRPNVLYNLLCQLTHPSMASVMWGLGSGLRFDDRGEFVEPGAGPVTYTVPNDARAIEQICAEFGQILENLPQYAFNGPLLLLKTLNRFPISELHTPAVEGINTDATRAWHRIETAFASMPKPDTTPAKGRERNLPCPCGSGKKSKRCCGAS